MLASAYAASLLLRSPSESTKPVHKYRTCFIAKIKNNSYWSWTPLQCATRSCSSHRGLKVYCLHAKHFLLVFSLIHSNSFFQGKNAKSSTFATKRRIHVIDNTPPVAKLLEMVSWIWTKIIHVFLWQLFISFLSLHLFLHLYFAF